MTQSPEETFFKIYSKLEADLENTLWFEELESKFKNGVTNSFLITGNVFDQAVPGVSFEAYLKDKIYERLGIDEMCVFDHVFVNDFPGFPDTPDYPSIQDRVNNIVNIIKYRYNQGAQKAAIIKFPDMILPNSRVTSLDPWQLHALTSFITAIMSDKMAQSGNLLIFLCESKSNINSRLYDSSSKLREIKVKHPSKEDRVKMFDFLCEACKTRFELDGMDSYSEVAELTSGFTRNNIEELWRSCSGKRVISRDDITLIKEEMLKREYGDYLDIYEPCDTYNLVNYGGMSHVKNFLREGVINPIKRGDIDMVPKGLLFMGAPGTGKTYLAKCLASESGISFVEIKMSKILSKWVGETEHNLEKVFTCIESLSPVFVFIDEIEQSIQRGENDTNDNRSNIFQMIVNFMSRNENRGRVIWIAATNYPNKMDEALKRAGRFDTKLVFAPPSNIQEIDEVFQSLIKRVKFPNGIDFASSSYNICLDRLTGYTQAEIESVIVKSISLCRRRGLKALTTSTVFEAIGFLKKSRNDKTDEMLKIAVEECNDLEFLPSSLQAENSSNKMHNDKSQCFGVENLTSDEMEVLLKYRMDKNTRFYI